MLSRSHKGLFSLYILRRGIALFFILFTFGELIIPDICTEELGGLPVRASHPATADARPADDWGISIHNTESKQEEESKPSQSGEDCFCCCSHILPSFCLSFPAIAVKTPVEEIREGTLPTPPIHTLYHPPRFA